MSLNSFVLKRLYICSCIRYRVLKYANLQTQIVLLVFHVFLFFIFCVKSKARYANPIQMWILLFLTANCSKANEIKCLGTLGLNQFLKEHFNFQKFSCQLKINQLLTRHSRQSTTKPIPPCLYLQKKDGWYKICCVKKIRFYVLTFSYCY